MTGGRNTSEWSDADGHKLSTREVQNRNSIRFDEIVDIEENSSNWQTGRLLINQRPNNERQEKQFLSYY